MRAILTSLVLALILLAPSTARAQYPGYYYGSYFYPPAYGYYYAPPVYPPYVWSGRYYANPFSRGWAYQEYYPYTNSYFYQYRVRPNYWRWR